MLCKSEIHCNAKAKYSFRESNEKLDGLCPAGRHNMDCKPSHPFDSAGFPSAKPEQKSSEATMREENQNLKQLLVVTDEKSMGGNLALQSIQQDIYRLNCAYVAKCQENKILQEEIAALRAGESSVSSLRLVQQDFGRLQLAYTVKAQENKRLGQTIDALVAERSENQQQCRWKSL